MQSEPRPPFRPSGSPARSVDEKDTDAARSHGAHTLRRVRGTVVGLDRDDVFVDLGPRQQGLISASRFQRPPSLGDSFEFTLGGQEQGLWRLEIAGSQPSVAWERMEPGLLVEARVIGVNPGGLDLKVGGLHAFMPRSHTGLGRREKPQTLIGKTLAVEVLEVDRERQRVLLSRKLVQRRERSGGRARDSAALRPGQVVEGRVVRLESFGAFVRFGANFEGLLHVSNLSHEHVEDPSAVLHIGQRLHVRVLSVRADGKRIGLGLKQMDTSPWPALERAARDRTVVTAEVLRVEPVGLTVRLDDGVEGFVPRSETGLGPLVHLRQHFQAGQRIALCVREADGAREKLVLSRLHGDGSTVCAEEWDPDDEIHVEREPSGSDGLHWPAPPPEEVQPGRSVRLARELLREVRELDVDAQAS